LTYRPPIINAPVIDRAGLTDRLEANRKAIRFVHLSAYRRLKIISLKDLFSP
jgi:hypothetical protein